MVAIDVQLAASHAGWPTVRAASICAEEAGYDAIWALDHLAGDAFDGRTALECFTWLGALAEATSTIELGALVANVWNRQVGVLAVAAASVAEVSARRFWLGVGAGAAPGSRWATEQHAVDAEMSDDLSTRHRRVERFLDLTDELWHPDRPDRFDAFPQPSPEPPRIVGVNSVELATLAGLRAEGVNVAWSHPRRDDFIDAARRAAGDRPFLLTAWTAWEPGLRDPDHPVRVAMDRRGIDRVILAVLDDLTAFLDET
jgi:alkanesulfonate monooxygenase SsuD/methylene tetrahydromethanopterin reductase-like flavin-dependent oxidoreductase (luciferase family)